MLRAYADDIALLATTQRRLSTAMHTITPVLTERGLALSGPKSKVAHAGPSPRVPAFAGGRLVRRRLAHDPATDLRGLGEAPCVAAILEERVEGRRRGSKHALAWGGAPLGKIATGMH